MQTTEKMIRMDEYRTNYEKMTRKRISQNFFEKDTSWLPTWEYCTFLESALIAMEERIRDLRGAK